MCVRERGNDHGSPPSYTCRSVCNFEEPLPSHLVSSGFLSQTYPLLPTLSLTELRKGTIFIALPFNHQISSPFRCTLFGFMLIIGYIGFSTIWFRPSCNVFVM
uniref:Uncharacterized protein n=1 Tax=Glycine max TaxID=3847 RepID=K7LSX4_SOYBN